MVNEALGVDDTRQDREREPKAKKASQNATILHLGKGERASKTTKNFDP